MPKILAPADPKKYHFNVGHQFGVDATTGNLTGLQLMAAGREAKGHGIYIDDRTLESGAQAVADRGGRIKAYVTHNHGGACSWDQPDMAAPGSELNIPGFFSAIAVKKSQLIAGQFEFFDAFKKNFLPQYEQLLEMAKKTPDLLGISVEVWGYLAYVAKDGTEYSSEPDDIELLYNGLPALRITDMWAAAFVADGAATDGLFAKLSRVFGGKRSVEERAALKAALVEFAEKYTAEENTLPLPGNSEHPPLSAIPDLSPMSLTIASLKAKFGTDAKKFGAAAVIVGNKPEITMEALEAQMVQEDLAAARAEVVTVTANLGTVTAELTALKGTVTSLTAERDDWKKKFETLKASGLESPQNLGAASGGAGADQVNPWLKATKNLTAQAKLLKSNPELAKAFKAAAEAEKAK